MFMGTYFIPILLPLLELPDGEFIESCVDVSDVSSLSSTAVQF